MDFTDGGQPTVNGLLIRSVDALDGQVKDMDTTSDGHRRVLVEFPHERVDTYKTTFGADAFRDSFKQRLPVMCWQHDLRDPIGRVEDAQITPKVNELVGRFSKDLDAVPSAKRALSQIEDGTLTDFSFGFREPKYEAHPQFRGVRRIKWAIMKEISPVTIGSIPDAVATGVREEDIMAEWTVEQIIEMRDKKVINGKQAQALIRAIAPDSLRQHIVITGGKEEAQPIEGTLMPDGTFRADDGTVIDPATITAPSPDKGGEVEDEVPEVINARAILDALPEAFQRTIVENGARVFLVVGDEEWGPISERSGEMDGTAVELLAQADLALRHSVGWIGDVDLEAQPEAIRQAAALVTAAGNAAAAALEIADPDGAVRDAAENMAPEPVKCEECDGTGKVDASGDDPGGKVCPRCHGSGVEAAERADLECNVCHGSGKVGIPGKDEKECSHCHGTGKVSDYKPDNRAPYWEEALFLRFVSEDDRKKMADSGEAMSNGDFPIPDKGHLSSALGHWSSYTGDKAEAKAHIEKRAKALGVTLSDDDFQGSRADWPEGAKSCAKCKGDGKLPAPKQGGHRLTCPDCHGKGWMKGDDTRAKPDDDNDSQDDMVDESGDGKPSGTGPAASEDKRTEEEKEIDALRDEALGTLDRRVGSAA